MRYILASQSPRRVSLLEQFKIPFIVFPSHIEENIDPLDSPEKTVMSLAFLKAREISVQHKDDLVIACDTMVYMDVPFGKPLNIQEAKDMLSSLSGRKHDVYTGVALLCESLKKKVVFFEKTEVFFNDLSSLDIENYVMSEHTLDKAGAYGIQGLGAVLVNAIHGDYYNVMGLPLSHLNQQLKEHFGVNLL